MKIDIKEIIHRPQATVRTDGVKVYETLLDNKEKVEVDFSNITMVVSSFLNAAIGKLYGKYSEQFINENVKIIGLCDDDMELLNDIVIPNAKSFFENQSKIENIEKNKMNLSNLYKFKILIDVVHLQLK